jgi:hypothetical protein
VLLSFRCKSTDDTTIEEQVYREDAPGNAVVARARRWRPQVNGRRNDNKSNLLGRAPRFKTEHFRGVYPGMRVAENLKLDLMTFLKYIFF